MSIEVLNIALEALGEPNVSAPRETPLSSRLDARLPRVAREMFEGYPWNFASQRLELAQLPEEPIGYDYAYAVPAGAVRIVWLSQDGSDEFTLRVVRYAEESGRILADVSPLYGLFTMDRSQDFRQWPQVFSEAMGLELAVRENRRVTQSNSAGLSLEERCEMAWKKAQTWDAQRVPWQQKPVGRFVSSRWSGLYGGRLCDG